MRRGRWKLYEDIGDFLLLFRGFTEQERDRKKSIEIEKFIHCWWYENIFVAYKNM